MTPILERRATTPRLRQAGPRSKGKNYRNIFYLLKLGTVDRAETPDSFERPLSRIIRRGDPWRVRFGLGGPGTHTRTRAHLRAGTCRESAWTKHFRVVRLMNHLRWLWTLPLSPVLRFSSLYIRAFRRRFPLAIRLLALKRLSGVLELAIRSDLIDTPLDRLSTTLQTRSANSPPRVIIKIICSFDKACCRYLQGSMPAQDADAACRYMYYRLATGKRENFISALCESKRILPATRLPNLNITDNKYSKHFSNDAMRIGKFHCQFFPLADLFVSHPWYLLRSVSCTRYDILYPYTMNTFALWKSHLIVTFINVNVHTITNFAVLAIIRVQLISARSVIN